MKTLIVEDDATTRTMLERVLKSRGHEVTACESAESGWNAFECSGYSLILLNWMLPGISGVELCRKIRAHRRGDESVIVMITGRDQSDDLREVLAAGADDYVSKPFGMKLLDVRLTIAERKVELLLLRIHAEKERATIEAQMRLAQKLESLGVMAGGIAHDFNNLLVAIMGNASLAMGDLEEDSMLLPYLKNIEEASVRASDLTSQLLAYAGKGAYVVDPLDVNRLVSEMAGMVRAVTTKKCEIGYHLAPSLPTIEADASQIRQVVMNFVANASEALGEEGGEIEVRTGQARLTNQDLGSMHSSDDAVPGRFVYVEVSDSGMGMDEQTVAKIFDPFFTTKFAGRGLGLAAVWGIVRAHRGTISVSSRKGAGSTFRAYFPQSDREATQPLIPAPGRVPRPATDVKGTVLVVDDEPSVLDLAKRSLEKYGFDVIPAGSTAEAIERFMHHRLKIRAVVLDLTMPHGGGERVLKEIRNTDPSMPVILSSGYTEADVRNRFEGDLSGFLHKPYRPTELVDIVRKAIAS